MITPKLSRRKISQRSKICAARPERLRLQADRPPSASTVILRDCSRITAGSNDTARGRAGIGYGLARALSTGNNGASAPGGIFTANAVVNILIDPRLRGQTWGTQERSLQEIGECSRVMA